MIKNIIFRLAILMLLLGTFISCLDYEDLRENPNEPTSVPPSLIFTQVLPSATSAFGGTYEYPQYHIRSNADGNPVDYRFNSTGFNYGVLRNVKKMEEEADRANAPVYFIMAKFLRAYYYVNMTRYLGDVPLSEAMKGEENPKPKYDTQKSVYIQVLNWLDEASIELNDFILNNPGTTIEGDIYFNGNLKNWQKVINAYTIRVLSILSKKENDNELNIKGRMANIINNPSKYPLMTSLNDNMQLTHKDEDDYRGTYNPTNAAYKIDVILAKTIVDLLKINQDPRLKTLADPTPNAIAANSDIAAVRADFNSYEGADTAESTSNNVLRRSDGEISTPNEERYWNFVGQPSIVISYFEQELYIAEAAHRGWISANAKEHYDKGVLASMEYFGVSNSDATDYITTKQPYITGTAGLTRIHEQMYIAFTENSGWESFFLTRRTGVPTYSFSANNNVTQLPVRWSYPTSEDDDNRENYRAALVSQFGAEIDDRDQIIWQLKD